MPDGSQLFAHLFMPLKIGGVEVANRILSTGHDTSMAHEGRVTDAMIAYHEARARGGAGLIVSQVVGVHETARYTSHVLMGTDDGCLPGFERLAQVVHAHGTRIFAQLFHPGREIMEVADGTAPVAYSASATPSDRFHVIPRAMTLRMIREVVAGYAAAARRMQQAGLDGVEIVASHGYLPAQFLSPQVNRREDDYGRNFDNRLRFVRELVEAVRAASTGPGFVIGLRISGDEHIQGGMEDADSLEVIRALASRLDYVSVIAGTSASLGGAIHIVPPMFQDAAYLAPFAHMVKQAVDIPVMVAGRINQPQEAEGIIATGQADMCGMTRALICDPMMPLKAKADRPDDIRACIGCNQACIGHFHKGVPISCIQFPESGRELTYGTRRQTTMPKTVMVIGGGPAGMKAAATAAALGHDVTLHEAAAQLGGQALLAQMLPGRTEFGGIITNLSREMELAGVTVCLNSGITADAVAKAAPDAVIVATGGTARIPQGMEFSDDAHIVTAWDVLRSHANVGGSVTIADWRADWVGLGVAELLASAGRRVRLCVNGTHAGEMLQSYVRDTMVGRVQKLGVEIIPYAQLFGADDDTAYFINAANNEPMLVEGTDTLVLAQGTEVSDALLTALDDYAGEIIGIGDCMAPRTAEEAVLDGLKAAWAL
ncbi:FAD-dependent oxidoreductase [Roseovarius sp. M141]|uniref:oxidoreductase n=1 Tax=Roseovarius sp. M141 TaxID=2583806 RepID=UPI0020CB7756|nr:FAD-dependent oxidoreductase [Roseovarius sp. M141]MCQ0091655.1 FAD-binding protein [Roseovarius sp. M141]